MLTPPAPARCQRRARLYVAITLCAPCNASPRTGAGCDARPLRHMPSYMPSQTHAKSRRPECIRQPKMARTRAAKRRAHCHQGDSCVCAGAHGHTAQPGTTCCTRGLRAQPARCAAVSPLESVCTFTVNHLLCLSLSISVSQSLFLSF